MIKKYIEKEPSIIKAVHWTGNNFEEVDKFCTVEYKDSRGKNKEYHYAEIWDDKKQRIVLKGDMWCGDGANVGDYIVAGDEFYHVEPEDFESKWEPTEEPHTYKGKVSLVVEAIQWTDDNTEECLDFIGSNGRLDASGFQILIMNLMGGSVTNKGDFIIKWNNEKGDDFYSLSSEFFNNSYKELPNE